MGAQPQAGFPWRLLTMDHKNLRSSVFDGAMNSPYTEDDLSNPINAADATAMIVQRAWQACFTPEILPCDRWQRNKAGET